jgi:antitoxin component YwqK of YwqJK toxin-antitoxin module
MYRYNSTHKIIVAFLIFGWAVYHFAFRSDPSLYFENGQVKRTGSQVNSLNEGTWTWYHENGQIQIQGNFHKGQKDGLWKTYDNDGNIISETHYDMGIIVSED